MIMLLLMAWFPEKCVSENEMRYEFADSIFSEVRQ
jgi:hypothetical protein